jgi:hypothetical protein
LSFVKWIGAAPPRYAGKSHRDSRPVDLLSTTRLASQQTLLA